MGKFYLKKIKRYSKSSYSTHLNLFNLILLTYVLYFIFLREVVHKTASLLGRENIIKKINICCFYLNFYLDSFLFNDKH